MNFRVCILLLFVGTLAGGDGFSLPALRLAPFYESKAAEPSSGGSVRARAFGPLFSLNEPLWPAEQLVSAYPRPAYVQFRDADSGTTGIDSFWPLAVHRRRPGRRSTRLALAYYSHQEGEGDDSDDQLRWGLIPILWGGRVPDKGSYFALFPAGGVVHDMIGYDHIRFALFPLYLNTVRTGSHQHSLLWPIFSVTRSDGRLEKWRVFPLIGGARSASKRQYFALWPLLHAMRENTDEGRTRKAFAFLPFYGQLTETDDRTSEETFWSRTVLWPLFSGATGHGMTRLHLLYPFYQSKTLRKNEEIVYKKQFFWPFYGTRERSDEHYRFIAWPFHHQWIQQPDENTTRKHQYFLPFYWSSVLRENDRVTRSRHHVWPLVRTERRGQYSLTTALALWPYGNAAPIQRSYAPFWTLYARAGHGRGFEEEALWGLWQYAEQYPEKSEETDAISKARWRLFPFVDARRDGENYSVSFLKGLLKVTNAEDQKNRLFWLLKW
ncbi:MAG: hypothetical protein ACOCWJ_01510 [Verrucomicrobiota bacterium]